MQTVPDLLLSLVSQLLWAESTLPEELVACYEAHVPQASRPSLSESTQLLQSVVARCGRVFIIIDAFDECSEECRALFLTEIKDLRSSMNVLITSRDLPNIEHGLTNAERLDVQANKDDILQYIRERVAHSERIRAHASKDPNLGSLISATIADRAKGM